MAYFLCVIGMVLVIEGIPYMVFPRRVKMTMRLIEKVPESTLQVAGLVAALIGVCIIYFGRYYGG